MHYLCKSKNLTIMQEYIVSARKYRPMTFDTVVGQSALTTTLKNAVKSGKLAHAYLFCGPRGVGKTTCARIFAKAINCMSPTVDGEACNNCESCQAFNENRSYNIFELDAASNNGVEHIKSLMEQTRIPPQVGKYKVFIIDEVHMLSPQAFNAFLKTLEEPPAHVVFILATTEKNKILPTIISRCQIYDFERMTVQGIVDHLKMVAQKEGVTYEDEALDIIAEKADGGMRDALSIFDQAVSFCQGNITYKKVIEDLNVLDSDNYFNIVDLALENKVSDIMLLVNSIIGSGFDGGNIVLGLAKHIRNVLMAKDPQTLSLLEVSQQQRDKFGQQASRCPVKFLYKALKILNQCDINYRQSNNKRLLVELTLIQVAQITQPDDDEPGAGRSPKRLKTLFRKIMNVQHKATPQVIAAATPAPAPKPAQRRLKLDQITISFGSLKKKNQEEKLAEDTETTTTSESDKFTQEQLQKQWNAMCERMAQLDDFKALAARMKNCTPTITDYPNIEVVVDNNFMLEQMNNIKGRLRKTLANNLNNGNITLSIRTTEGEEIRHVLTPKEHFELLMKDNPSLEKLRKELGLTVM